MPRLFQEGEKNIRLAQDKNSKFKYIHTGLALGVFAICVYWIWGPPPSVTEKVLFTIFVAIDAIHSVLNYKPLKDDTSN